MIDYSFIALQYLNKTEENHLLINDERQENQVMNRLVFSMMQSMPSLYARSLLDHRSFVKEKRKKI